MTTLAHTLGDSRVMLRSNLKHQLRYPSLTVMLVAMPIVFLLLFVYVFGGQLGAGLDPHQGRHAYLDYVLPGVLLITVGSAVQGTAIMIASDMTGDQAADHLAGVTRRCAGHQRQQPRQRPRDERRPRQVGAPRGRRPRRRPSRGDGRARPPGGGGRNHVLAQCTLSLRYSEKLIRRFGARTMQFPGLGLMVAGMVLLAHTPVHGSYLRDVLPAMLLTGTGVGLCFPALMGLAMSGATPSDAGLASGLANTAAQVGGALGLAVLATVSSSRSKHLAHAGTPHAQALTGGYHLAFLIAAGLIAAAVVQSEKRAAAARARADELAYERC